MIEQQRIDVIKNIPIEDAIGRYVPLQKKGHEYVGCCPFHEEKTPSFKVNPTKKIFKCFGCGESGMDSIAFVEKRFNLSFIEAVEKLEQDNGLTMGYKPLPPPAPVRKKRTVEPPKQPEKSYAAEQIRKGLIFAENNPFHVFLREKFTTTYQNLIGRFSIGTSARYFFGENKAKTVFWYESTDGKYLNAKVIPYGNDGKRIKDKNDRSSAPFWAGKEDDGYTKCLFGEKYIPEYGKDAYIAVVESEKSVVICHSYAPHICWVAKGASTGLTDSKLFAFQGRHVLLFADADQAGRKTAATDKEKLLDIAASVTIVDLFPDKSDKTDIADWFLAEEVTEDDIFHALLPPEEPVVAAEPEEIPVAEVDMLNAYRGLVRTWIKNQTSFYSMLGDNNIGYLRTQFPLLSIETLRKEAEKIKELGSLDENEFDEKDTYFSTAKFIDANIEFADNVITDQRVWRMKGSKQWQILEKRDRSDIYHLVKGRIQKAKKQDVETLIDRKTIYKAYNPIKEYFESLPAWDGVDYISEFASLVRLVPETYSVGNIAITAQAFFIEMLKKALIRSLHCSVGIEGKLIPNRIVMTLSSPNQRIGKTSFIRKLMPSTLKDYYTQEPPERNVDTKARICKNFIFNLDEFEPTKAFSLRDFKELLSRDSSNVREAYRENAARSERIANFWATTNEGMFLEDTINTRWMVFRIESFDSSIWNFDINKVWAHAYALFKQGHSGNLTDDEEAIQELKNKPHRITDEYEDIIMAYLVPVQEERGIFMASTEIINYLTKSYDIVARLHSIPFGRKLAELGFIRSKYNNRYGYWYANRSQIGTSGIGLQEDYERSRDIGF